jgi:hypothetical protein
MTHEWESTTQGLIFSDRNRESLKKDLEKQMTDHQCSQSPGSLSQVRKCKANLRINANLLKKGSS